MIIKKVVLITKSEIICLHIFILLIFCILCIAGSSLQSKLYDEYFFFPFSSHLMMTCFFLIRIDISFLR
ncbi:hypothetical protein EXX78_00330 [Escherichia coli]|nr:hypothetical protein EXX78_00330 [Escherichia coli]